MAFTKMLVN